MLSKGLDNENISWEISAPFTRIHAVKAGDAQGLPKITLPHSNFYPLNQINYYFVDAYILPLKG